MARFTHDTFSGWDYIPDVFTDWVDAPDGVFLAVTTADDGGRSTEGGHIPAGQVLAVARVTFLSGDEAWLEGIRVDPLVRGQGVATDLQVAELRWAAAHGSSVLRYLTGETNEGSHRLGARHGFEVIGATRWYGWDDETTDEPPGPPDDPSAVASQANEAPGVLRPGVRTDEWFEAIRRDPTVVAAGGLYEPRGWALQAFTRQRLDEHLAAGDVLVWPPGAKSTGPDDLGWGLAIIRTEPDGEGDPRLPPGPALVAGDGRAVLELLRCVGGGRPGLPYVRLPDPDPLMLSGGIGDEWAASDWMPYPRGLHVVARAIDRDHPIPPPDDPALLLYEEEPRSIATSRMP